MRLQRQSERINQGPRSLKKELELTIATHLKERDMPDKTVKVVEIYLNEDTQPAPKDKITYEEVIALYLQNGSTPSNEYLVKYSRGHSSNISGTLVPGGKVMVQDGMRFRVSGAGES